MLVLTRSQVRELVPMPDAIELMKMAFAELSAGRTVSPLRTVIPIPEIEGDALVHAGIRPGDGRSWSQVGQCFSPQPGQRPAGHSRHRRAGRSGVRAAAGNHGWGLSHRAADGRRLRRRGRSARPLRQRGAGRNRRRCAGGHPDRGGLRGASNRAGDRSGRQRAGVGATATQTPAQDWPEIEPRLETTTDAAAAVRQADIICTATTSHTPVFRDEDVRPGTHISAVGAYTPEMQELPAETVARATVVVDAVDAALAEAGDLIIPIERAW